MIRKSKKAQDLVHKLALEYHTRTEKYDKTVCSLKNAKGVAMPANFEQAALVTDYAWKVYDELCAKLDKQKRALLWPAIISVAKKLDAE